MRRPPRPVDAPILDIGLGVRTLLVSLLLGGAAFGMFEWGLHRGLSDAGARTLTVNTIVVVEAGYLFACRSMTLPIWKLGWFSNLWVYGGALAMLVAQLLFTYVPVMNRLFHTEPIEPWWWGVMSAAGFGVFVLAELKKLFVGGPKTEAAA